MKVSVIITTYNQASHVETAISSVVRNTHREFELFIMDQSSDTLTEKMVQIYAAQDERVKYFHREEKGKNKALNFGIKMSLGEIIAITDHDCEVAEDWLEKMILVFNRYANVDIVFGSLIPGITNQTTRIIPGVIVKDRLFSGPCSKIFENGMGCNMGIRKRLFEKIGYFDELIGPGNIFPAGDEVDFSYRALERGCIVAHSSMLKVTHWGIRDMQFLREYRISDAAVFFKHIRCFDLAALYVLIGLYVKYVYRIIKSADVNKSRIIPRIVFKFRLVGILSSCYIKGIVLSMKFPVDRKYRIYRLPNSKVRNIER